jgi:hypothetical protein
MKKTKEEIGREVYWTIISDGEVVYKSFVDNNYWKGGSDLFMPIWKDREEAQKEIRKIKNDWRVNFPNVWFRTIPIRIVRKIDEGK